VHYLFAYPEHAVSHMTVSNETAGEGMEEESVLDGDLADLEPAVRDAVVTALPFAPLCRVDCPGLCSECGARLVDDPGHRHDVGDPRWSALAPLRDAGPHDARPFDAGPATNASTKES
jgi:uncharacterized protein